MFPKFSLFIFMIASGVAVNAAAVSHSAPSFSAEPTPSHLSFSGHPRPSHVHPSASVVPTGFHFAADIASASGSALPSHSGKPHRPKPHHKGPHGWHHFADPSHSGAHSALPSASQPAFFEGKVFAPSASPSVLPSHGPRPPRPSHARSSHPVPSKSA